MKTRWFLVLNEAAKKFGKKDPDTFRIEGFRDISVEYVVIFSAKILIAKVRQHILAKSAS